MRPLQKLEGERHGVFPANTSEFSGMVGGAISPVLARVNPREMASLP